MAIAFLNYSRRQIMGRTSRARMLVGSEKHRKVDDSLISIPDRVDSIYYDGMMYILTSPGSRRYSIISQNMSGAQTTS